MFVGKILWFDMKRGYGRIRPAPDQGVISDAFLHHTECREFQPLGGLSVVFELGTRHGRTAAVNVKPRGILGELPKRQGGAIIDNAGLARTLGRGETL